MRFDPNEDYRREQFAAKCLLLVAVVAVVASTLMWWLK